MGFGAFSVWASSVSYTYVTVMSQRLKPLLSTTEASPHEVGGVNPNNVRRNWVTCSQPPPTRPAVRQGGLSYTLHAIFSSYQRNKGVGGEGCGAACIRERNSNQLSMLIHSHDRRGGGHNEGQDYP